MTHEQKTKTLQLSSVQKSVILANSVTNLTNVCQHHSESANFTILFRALLVFFLQKIMDSWQDRVVAAAFVGGTLVSVVLYFGAAPTIRPLPPLARSVKDVVNGFSGVLLVVIGLAAVLHVAHAWDDLWRVHVVVSLLLALSGVAACATSHPLFRRAYAIIGSVSWYGVVYSFVATSDRIQMFEYLRPGLLLAFTTYAGALLTCPLVAPAASASGSVAGLLCLLSYFWAVELPLVRAQHSHFKGSAMHRLPPRLAGLGLEGGEGEGASFASHRVAYSAVLCLCHAVSLWLMQGTGLPMPDVSSGKKQDGDNDNDDGPDAEASASAAAAAVKSRLRRRAQRGASAQADRADLPDDCVEISLDDALTLTGGRDTRDGRRS